MEISGAKNAAVAILPAALLVDGVCRIENVPNISDVTMILGILRDLGAKVRMINPTTVELDCSHVHKQNVPYELARQIRASYYLIGALLGRFGRAEVPPPGGCDLGVRPIDQHLKGFSAMGTRIQVENGFIHAAAPTGRLHGAQIYLDVVSVGATMNILLAAALADGLTIIENAAKEPHIVDLANFLNSMGADIMGAGTDVIKVRGVKKLRGGVYSIIPDQIEAGTYMTAVAAAGGEVRINNIIPKHLDCITAKLVEMGVDVEEDGDSLIIRREGKLTSTNVKTMPYPGFPTDAQAPVMSMAALAVTGTEGLVLLFMGVAASCYGGLASLLTPLTARMFGPRYITENYGVMYVVFGLASLIGPSLATTFKTAGGGSYTGAYVTAAALAVIGLALSRFLKAPSCKGE